MHPELARGGDDRDDFQRDRDIILYTRSLGRLSGITQVLSPEAGHVLHNRLTHTLQVAQVGRRLAEKLLKRQFDLSEIHGVNADVVESACLAHDLGHPPFGHLAEEALNDFAADHGGFEGNAQSFRILTKLAFRRSDFTGLNLTRRTLKATLKYPWRYAERLVHKPKKWGAYDSEEAEFKFAVGESGLAVRSAEAEIMDWADDVTYSVHDVEDFYRAGLIPLHLLRPVQVGGYAKEHERFLQYVRENRAEADLSDVLDTELEKILEDILSFFAIDSSYRGSKKQRASLRTFTSALIGRYINGPKLVDANSGASSVYKDPDQSREIAVLKQLTWCYVIDAPSLAMQQKAQRKIILTLCREFLDEAQSTRRALIPEYYREVLDDGVPPVRVVVDLVAGMTERQAVNLYHQMEGIKVVNGLDPPFV